MMRSPMQRMVSLTRRGIKDTLPVISQCYWHGVFLRNSQSAHAMSSQAVFPSYSRSHTGKPYDALLNEPFLQMKRWVSQQKTIISGAENMKYLQETHKALTAQIAEVATAIDKTMKQLTNPAPGANLDDLRNYVKRLEEKEAQLLSERAIIAKQLSSVPIMRDYSAFEEVLQRPLSEVQSDLEDSKLKKTRSADTWLQALANEINIVKHDEKSGLTVLGMPGADIPGNPFKSNLSNDLFVRDFYDDLFKTLWGFGQVAVIGNPGLGKSWYQLYCLLRAFHPTGPCIEGTDRPLWTPPSEDWTAPEVVLRHLSPNEFEVYLIKKREMWTAKSSTPYAFINLFDPKKTLYLFEPRQTKDVEPCLVEAKTIATLSPQISRIKEFRKRAQVRYMPIWNLAELQTAAAYIRQQHPTSTAMQELLEPDAVEHRFDRFGGILRYVVPESGDLLARYAKYQSEAIDTVDFNLLSKAGLNIDGGVMNVSHHIMQYDVDKTDFGDFRLKYPGPIVEVELQQRAAQREFHDNLNTLRECIQGKFKERMRVVLEPVTWEMLRRGVKWQFWPNADSAQIPQIREYRYIDIAKLGGVQDLEDGVLYVPVKPNFPLIEAFMKGPDGTMIGFQCKSGTAKRFEPRTAFSLRQELEKTGWLSHWHIFIVATPLNVESWINLLRDSPIAQSCERAQRPVEDSVFKARHLPSPWGELKYEDQDKQPTKDTIIDSLKGMTFSVLHHAFDGTALRQNANHARSADSS